MAKRTRANLEFLLVKAELNGIPEKGLLRSRNIGKVDSQGGEGMCLDRINKIDRIIGV